MQSNEFVRLHERARPASLDIGTPERVALSFQVAELGTRFYALLIDTIIQGFLQIGLAIAIAFMFAALSGLGGGAGDRWLVVALYVITFLIQFGYFILIEWRSNGQTPGKAIMGLRVVKQDGSPFTLADSFTRNLIRVFEFLPLFYALGALVMLFGNRSQRLGDLAARTLVVNDRGNISATSLYFLGAHAAPLPPGAWQSALRRLTATDVARAEALLARAPQLINLPQVAALLAADLRAKLGDGAVEIDALPLPPGPAMAQVNPDVAFLRRITYGWRAA
jgi:uncharacterized RDD family membrane protein YckC